MVELKLKDKKQDIRVLKDEYSETRCEGLVIQNKAKAFSMLSSVRKIFKKNQYSQITHKEKRYEPFWNIEAEGYVEYFRKNNYQIDVDAQVRDIEFNKKKIIINEEKPIAIFECTDHCVEHNEKRVLISAINKKEKNLEKYIKFTSKKIKETEELMGKNKVVLPATIKASFLIRDLFKELIRPVHADKIVDESVTITKMILYFRPIYAFELTNSEGEKGVLEVDALTGEIKTKGFVYKKEIAEYISEDALFDVGAELAASIIPGAGVVAVVGRQIHTTRKKKKKTASMQKSKSAMSKRKSTNKTSKKKK